MVIGDNLQKEMVKLHPITNITTCKTNGKALKYSHLVKAKTKKVRGKGMCNEIVRLSKGFDDNVGTNTILFI